MRESKPTYFIFDQQTTTDNVIVDSDNSGYAIDLVITSIPVVAETRKIRVQWTPELAQDLQMYANINAIDELTELSELHQSFREKAIAKKRRYKDRKMYIKMLEEWSGEQINKGDGGINN